MGHSQTSKESAPSLDGRDTVPIPMWQVTPIRAQLVLLDVGPTPWLVADLLREVMSITITDPDALEQAAPIVLFRDIDSGAAEALLLRLQLAGALADLGEVQTRKEGFRPFRSRRTRPARAA